MVNPLPAKVIKNIPISASKANKHVLSGGSFLLKKAIIIGVMTTESCTIKAVLEPEVRSNANIQKVLLSTEERLTSILIKTALALNLPSFL